MQMQLNFDFATKPPLSKKRISPNLSWLDVSEIARGIGFTSQVEISIALNDVLEPLQSEIDGDYDQRLYDALWRAHFQLSLDPLPSAKFNFRFPRKDLKTGKISEIGLRLRAEAQAQVVLMGMLQEF
jgi:hypothetical protein